MVGLEFPSFRSASHCLPWNIFKAGKLASGLVLCDQVGWLVLMKQWLIDLQMESLISRSAPLLRVMHSRSILDTRPRPCLVVSGELHHVTERSHVRVNSQPLPRPKGPRHDGAVTI